MDTHFYTSLSSKSLNGEPLDIETCKRILSGDSIDLLSLLQAAYTVRHTHFNKDVTVHILNNAKNGNCPEDCSYCVQSKTSDAEIADYPMKSEPEIMEEARVAYESGAHRYCMVFAGRGPSKPRVKKLAGLIEKIKGTYPIQVCLSPGLIDDADALQLKAAGLDRLNHNLNTSKSYYEKICTTHTYEDRVNTLLSAQKAGLETCSGVIIGMGETDDDLLEVMFKLREMKAKSIPVNFYMPVEGAPLAAHIDPFKELNPQYCLRVLCLMRFLNPSSELRAAAGREIHLRHMQSMALYPANSLFMDGYLNTKGTNMKQTIQMIRDAGFVMKSDMDMDQLLATAGFNEKLKPAHEHSDIPILKKIEDLKPAF
jgi:biotin synthase